MASEPALPRNLHQTHIRTKADAKAAMLMQPARSEGEEAPPGANAPGWGEVGRGEGIDKVVVVVVVVVSGSATTAVMVPSSRGNRRGNRLDGAKEVVVMAVGLVRKVGYIWPMIKEHCPWHLVSISDHFRRRRTISDK